MNILFVCTGNISRSFLAEMLLKNEIKKRNLQDIAVASAGTSAYPGRPADPKMIEYLAEKGVPVEDHEASVIKKQNVDWADLILVMEREHLMLIGEQWPEAKEKMNLLGMYISEDHIVDDVIDPFGRSPYHYRLAQSQISLAVRSIVEKLPLEVTGD